MGEWGSELPAIAMVSMQFVAAGMALMTRAALVDGMSARVFVFYRQAIATLVIVPIAYFSRGKSRAQSSMSIKTFLLIFSTAFIGVSLNQNVYFEGLYLSSSSTATAMANLVPAVTFLLAAFAGMEKVNLKRLSSIAKILGTCFCVGGAVSMAVLRGPKLLNNQLPQGNSILLQSLVGGDTLLLGCVFIFASACCWSLWLLCQVPLTLCYPDHLSLSAWTCFLSTLQVGTIAFFLEQDPKAWILSSKLEVLCCIYAGILGSAVQFFVQSWCISRKGPLFSAMFSPLGTVITTVLACVILHEEIYTGSLLGGVTVIIGLYVVLWGKAEEVKEKLESSHQIAQETVNCDSDLEQPLLLDTSNTRDDLN